MAKPTTLTIDAGEHDRVNCPVGIDLPWSAAETGEPVLIDKASGKPAPCQVEAKGKKARLVWIISKLPAHERKVFELRRDGGTPAKTAVQVDDVADACRVDVSIGGSVFTAYHYGPQWVRPFLHPVMGPGGVRVTRNWPVDESVPSERKDHPHHKSIWVAYGECGKVDNWSEEPGHGWQRHKSFIRKASGPVFGQLTARIDWCTNKEKKQFEEVRDMRFYALPAGLRLFDVSVTFRMSEGPVTFHDTKEGGLLSVRVATEMDARNGGRIENAYGGINEGETWGKPSPWCDYSGVVDGVPAGIAVMDHEANPRYPTQWHVRNYGLMTANCFAWKYYRPDARQKGDMHFKKGSRTTWRYRVYIHRGGAQQAKVAGHFLNYVAPPQVTLE